MPLTSAQKNKIVQLLGYGGKTIQPGSVIYNKILNDRLDQMPVDQEHVVTAYLAQVQVIEGQMNAAPQRLIAKKVGDIEMNTRELEDLRRERKRIAREIAVLVDVPYQGTSANVSICV